MSSRDYEEMMEIGGRIYALCVALMRAKREGSEQRLVCERDKEGGDVAREV